MMDPHKRRTNVQRTIIDNRPKVNVQERFSLREWVLTCYDLRGYAASLGRFFERNPSTWVPFYMQESLAMGLIFKILKIKSVFVAKSLKWILFFGKIPKHGYHGDRSAGLFVLGFGCLLVKLVFL